MNEEPLLSVWCTAYNHEKYIRDALEGFLMQKTNFIFEVVVHDDASTDGTAEILGEYEKKYPQLFRVIYETENQYSKHRYNQKFGFSLMRKESRGKYIALCEGDDYWTDSNKLQMQIDYMEAHPDCVMTGHSCVIWDCKTDEKRELKLSQEKDISVSGLINDVENITTASIIIRHDMLDMDEFFYNVSVGDYPLKLFCLTKGKVHYFDKTMSTYRYMADGSWSEDQENNPSNYLTGLINIFVFMENYNNYTKKNYNICIKNMIEKKFSQIPIRFSKLSVIQFQNLCQKCDRKSELEAHKYYVRLIRLFKQHYDLAYLDTNVYDFIMKNRYVFIWGAGLYGKVMAKQISNNGLDFEGFIISDGQNGDKTYQSKTVWRWSELPYKKDESGIIIAAGVQYVREILMTLQNEDMRKVISPFIVDIDELIMEEERNV